MQTLANVLVGLVALIHGYFLVLEMFLWATPFGARAFRRPLDEMIAQKVLAANQGLYNGFLAAGLVWSLVAPAPLARPLAIFFLSCVVIAGLYGGATATRVIWWFQALPAAIGLLAVLAC